LAQLSEQVADDDSLRMIGRRDAQGPLSLRQRNRRRGGDGVDEFEHLNHMRLDQQA
jgi:hypothetical protein